MTVKIKVIDKVSPWLRLAALGLKDWKPALRTSGSWMFKSFLRQFRAEGMPRWKPLSHRRLMERIGGVRKQRKRSGQLAYWTAGQRTATNKRGKTRTVYLHTKGPESDKAYDRRMNRGLKRRKRESLVDYSIRKKAWKKRRGAESFGEFQARAAKKRGSLMRALNPKILQDTGALRRTYTTKSAPGSIYKLEDVRLTIGSQLVYSAIHQRSGWSGKNHRSFIPARPLNVLAEDRDEIKDIMRRHVLKAFNRRP